jgi:hypothetical protein
LFAPSFFATHTLPQSGYFAGASVIFSQAGTAVEILHIATPPSNLIPWARQSSRRAWARDSVFSSRRAAHRPFTGVIQPAIFRPKSASFAEHGVICAFIARAYAHKY